MGRPPRIQVSELHYHVIVRCNNGAFHFKTNVDFASYLQVIRLYKAKHQFKLFNYELMNSHVHLFLQPSQSIALEKTMHLINWVYACRYNKRNSRKGHFWRDRYKSILVESDGHALQLMRYINRNPVRAGMTAGAGEWHWSGYRYYAFGEPNELLEPHPSYLGLAMNEEDRRRAYARLVNESLVDEKVDKAKFSESQYIGSENFARRWGVFEDGG